MSLKNSLFSRATEYFLSRKRLLAKRAKAERLRQRQQRRHQLDYFHQLDDPYSAMLALILPAFLTRYDVEVRLHVVNPPADSAVPERERLMAYSLKDARFLAQYYGLDIEFAAVPPTVSAIKLAGQILIGAQGSSDIVDLLARVTHCLWSAPEQLSQLVPPQLPTQATTDDAMVQADRLRSKLGHYLGGMLFYESEWYWSLDRLHYLEQRLHELQAVRPDAQCMLFPAPPHEQTVAFQAAPAPIEFFFSLRSPYSAIAAARVFELARVSGAQVKLRYVLPMVMRGLPVPLVKRLYIIADVAREAYRFQVPFGRISDPVGMPTERGLAVMPYAEQQGRGQEWVLAFMNGVWAQGIDAGSNAGLKKIAQQAGLDWQGVQQALQHQEWRQIAEANRQAMFELGLWGVPSFRFGELAVWGQDRLWVIEQALGRSNERIT